ncbi:MAG: hypothetical protein FWH12_06155 [Treponema sp.]|nr:hypothetical protein [Treponema sp.]
MKKLPWKIAEPPVFKLVPEKPGIYIISTRQEVDHAYEVKYIGHADNLHERALLHWSKKEKNKELKEHIAEDYVMKFNYSEVESKADREGMLIYLHELFSPPFNTEPLPNQETVKCTIPGVRKYLA